MYLGTPNRHYKKFKQNYVVLYAKQCCLQDLYWNMAGPCWNSVKCSKKCLYAQLYIYRNKSYTVYKN